MINGVPHGPAHNRLPVHMQRFKDGDTVTIEPGGQGIPRLARPFCGPFAPRPIMQAGGFVSVNPAALLMRMRFRFRRRTPTWRWTPRPAIGCGACVAACRMPPPLALCLAKISQLAHLPQGRSRARSACADMVEQMDEEKIRLLHPPSSARRSIRKRFRYV